MPIIAYKYFTSWTIGLSRFPNLPVYADELDNWTLCGFLLRSLHYRLYNNLCTTTS